MTSSTRMQPKDQTSTGGRWLLEPKISSGALYILGHLLTGLLLNPQSKVTEEKPEITS